MKVGIPKESSSGETRVAVIPAGAATLTKAGLQVVVESGAGLAAGFTDAAYAAQNATIASRAETLASDILLQVQGHPSGQRPARRSDRHRVRRSAGLAAGDPRRRGLRRGDAVDGADAAHHARAEHGRAVVDGHDRRLQRRAARGQPAAAHVPDADDRRGHRVSGARLHRRRRRRRAPGDLGGTPAGREGRSVRRPPGGQGAGPESRRQVRRAAARVGGRRRQGRLRQGAGRIVLPPAARDDDQGRRRQRRRHHDGADPRQACADPRHHRNGRSDAAGIGRRRSGRRARRQLRADAARRDRRAQRRHDHRPVESGRR